LVILSIIIDGYPPWFFEEGKSVEPHCILLKSGMESKFGEKARILAIGSQVYAMEECDEKNFDPFQTLV
jgi:hypothetical protein